MSGYFDVRFTSADYIKIRPSAFLCFPPSHSFCKDSKKQSTWGWDYTLQVWVKVTPLIGERRGTTEIKTDSWWLKLDTYWQAKFAASLVRSDTFGAAATTLWNMLGGRWGAWTVCKMTQKCNHLSWLNIELERLLIVNYICRRWLPSLITLSLAPPDTSQFHCIFSASLIWNTTIQKTQ